MLEEKQNLLKLMASRTGPSLNGYQRRLYDTQKHITRLKDLLLKLNEDRSGNPAVNE